MISLGAGAMAAITLLGVASQPPSENAGGTSPITGGHQGAPSAPAAPPTTGTTPGRTSPLGISSGSVPLPRAPAPPTVQAPPGATAGPPPGDTGSGAIRPAPGGTLVAGIGNGPLMEVGRPTRALVEYGSGSRGEVGPHVGLPAAGTLDGRGSDH
ncbi:MAG: hypothetical protein NVSMB29_13870 [Candidatus Dormibacteria bacterium]